MSCTPPQMVTADSQQFTLPPELWIHIFHFATSCPALYASRYEPFDPGFLSGSACDTTLQVKSAITLVCRQWRDMAIHLLYEDVRIRHGDAALSRALKRDSGHDSFGCGRWVRRAMLPYSHSETATPHPLPVLDILRQCPQLEVLVRPPPGWNRAERLRFEFPADGLAFPLLKRLDWWHNNAAARTGGINSLDDVLRATPNLEYLSLGGDMWMVSLRQTRLELPRLKVLRLRHIDAIFMRQISIWSLPRLTHVVVEWPPHYRILESLWESLGHAIQVIELGMHLAFALRDHVSLALTSCPRLEVINYYAFFTSVPHNVTQTCLSLQRVGLHARSNLSIYPDAMEDSIWMHILEHLDSYRVELFPSLREFVLYGEEWRPITRHPRFAELEERVKVTGRVLNLNHIVRRYSSGSFTSIEQFIPG